MGVGGKGHAFHLLCFLQAVEVLREVLQEAHRRVSMHVPRQMKRANRWMVATHRGAIDFALVEDLEQSITGGGLEQEQHGCRRRLQRLAGRMTSAAVLFGTTL